MHPMWRAVGRGRRWWPPPPAGRPAAAAVAAAAVAAAASPATAVPPVVPLAAAAAAATRAVSSVGAGALFPPSPRRRHHPPPRRQAAGGATPSPLGGGRRGLCASPSPRDSAAAGGDPPREQLEYDVVIVGGGPAGLAAAIRLRQLATAAGGTPDLSVCVLEKGDEVGAHILSGNVLEPRALDELLPTWREDGAPTGVPATEDRFVYLTRNRAVPLPTPPQMHNEGNYVLSLSALTRWLGGVAEEAGVDIFPGFPAAELLLTDGSSVGPLSAAAARGRPRGGGVGVRGVVTADVGVAKDGSRKGTYAAGTEILGRLTLLAEGARGSLSEAAMAAFDLRADADPQTYALGIKEVWRLAPDAPHVPGRVWHSVGYPLDADTYGGSFLYHMDDRRVALGFVVGLDYPDASLSPYGEFQKWKAHPAVRPLLEGGEVLQYGARVLNEGGLQSVPRLAFPGGALVGCGAGFLNVPKIKGTHTAMKSGMLAAEAAYASLTADGAGAPATSPDADAAAAAPLCMDAYDDSLRASWVWDELRAVRNIRPGFHRGLLPGIANAALETYVTRGRSPWTLRQRRPDHAATRPVAPAGAAAGAPPPPPRKRYPKPDGKVTFDILTSVALSGTNHDHDSPAHLRLLDDTVPARVNWPTYGGPEGLYCPAKVYEYVDVSADAAEPGAAAAAAVSAATAGAAEGAAVNDHTAAPTKELIINAQNCLHCKACDVKDVTQNIKWTVPERGGPKYTMT